MQNDREELGRTATAAVSAAMTAAVPAGATLGRYRLERELGAGAMGVVHAAFDPDLERRIALKVLRGATATPEARDRLVREARAMARLAHPNVVTVYEVGTASGRDFVAMELICGETLDDWLHARPRTATAILDAFIAAGHGLAAAHAAGIVHRDFKPHNVLRSDDGRIVVTDFGLAREAEGPLPASLDATLSIGGDRLSGALARITATGSLLGTPAYMAPEQWRGDAVTPATDQFAYCVALWEALSGQRPYRGPTFDDLRRQVVRGPAVLDASRIPRRVRGILRRGLDPDPARRWPSMDFLLERLVRARRKPGLALAIAGGALLAAATLAFALRPGEVLAVACDAPARDVTTVWSPAIAAELVAKTSDAHAAVLATAFRDWQTARAAACTAPPQVRPAQLACLDGVLGRFDALRQAFARVPGSPAEDLQANLVDPAVCQKSAIADIPRLTLAPTPGVIAATALHARSETDRKPSDAELAALAGPANPDACSRVSAALAFAAGSKDVPQARSVMADAIGVADQCGDERLRADLLIRDSPYHWELPVAGPQADAAIQRAWTAATRVIQPELEAALAAQRSRVARSRGQWDEAFRWVGLELAAYRARRLPIRQVRAVIERNSLRNARTEPSDLEEIVRDVRTWRPVAVAHHQDELARQLDMLDAEARFQLGDVADAHADLIRLRPSLPRVDGSRTITGEVVDAGGRRVAGARVAAASKLFADASGLGAPRFSDDREDDLRIATSDAAGQFVITGAVPAGAIVAELADRRSPPAAITDHVTLVLEPTRRVSGKVDLAGTPYTLVKVYGWAVGDPTGQFFLEAPVAPDGSFELAGATTGALRLAAPTRRNGESDAYIEFQTFSASSQPLTGVALRVATSTRPLDVIVRSTVAAELSGAAVYLLPGKQHVARADDIQRLETSGGEFARPVTQDNAPSSVRDRVRPGDLVAHIDHAGPGDLTVCAVNFSGDWTDPDFRKRWRAHLPELPLTCESIGPRTPVVVLEVPPQQRLD